MTEKYVLAPQDALRALADGESVTNCNGYTWSLKGSYLACDSGARLLLGEWLKIAESKNPHVSGSFDWAQFEFRRGRSVRRGSWDLAVRCHAGLGDWDNDLRFRSSDFRATDWELGK